MTYLSSTAESTRLPLFIFTLIWMFSALFNRAYSDNSPLKHASSQALFIQQLDALRLERNIPGLSFAVVKDEKLFMAYGLGLADIAKQTLATATTPYDIASVAKPLSAVVALKLVEQGKLDLDKPMHTYSKWAGFCESFSQQPTPLAKGLDCSYTNHTLRNLLSHTAIGEPGHHFSYNPILYSWASRPIMSVTNKTFSSLVKNYVFEPANMQDAARKYRELSLPKQIDERQAQAYRIDENGHPEMAPSSGAHGDGAAGGVVASALDLAKFDIALDTNQLISAESRQQMMSPTKGVNGQVFDYGLGWFIQNYKEQKLVWHSGWWDDAYSALYLKVPDKHLSFIILANSEGIWWNNSPDKAEVENSEFAQLFLNTFVFKK